MNVIKYKELPGKLPVTSTITIIIALDYWNAPEWSYGVIGVFLCFKWAFCIYQIAVQKQTSIFDKK